ncbi:MAG: hypothetical protein GY785_13925 [Gammaproteobacteria bacterium]|nr:hypothetical protein [Gammaproteobacteria bacterium]
MKCDRNFVPVVLACLLLQACASGLEPQSSYSPPPGAAPVEEKSVDTGQLEATPGHRGDELGTEVIRYEEYDEHQSIELIVPIAPGQVDQVQVVTPSGEMIPQSRQAQIVHDYETNNVGIKIHVPKTDNLEFRLKLIDHTADEWPHVRQQ